jgi:hypothetical protein
MGFSKDDMFEVFKAGVWHGRTEQGEVLLDADDEDLQPYFQSALAAMRKRKAEAKPKEGDKQFDTWAAEGFPNDEPGAIPGMAEHFRKQRRPDD